MTIYPLFQFLDKTINVTVLDPSNQWDNVSRSTKSNYRQMALKAICALLSCLVPHQEEPFWNYIRQYDLCGVVTPSGPESKTVDCDINVVSSAMATAPNGRIRTQIQSLIAQKHTKNELISAIPCVTKWQVDVAREHAVKHSPGDLVPAPKIIRNRLSMDKATHFINFISQRQFVQDVAYGTQKVKLKSGETLNLPKVIRTLVLGRLIKLYKEYCQETNFDSFCVSTLYKIAHACPASQQQSLQGLDTTTAEGMTACSELEKQLEALKQTTGNSDLEPIISKLRFVHQYLKVSIGTITFIHFSSIVCNSNKYQQFPAFL